jgi:hypothetical protein
VRTVSAAHRIVIAQRLLASGVMTVMMLVPAAID